MSDGDVSVTSMSAAVVSDNAKSAAVVSDIAKTASYVSDSSNTQAGVAESGNAGAGGGTDVTGRVSIGELDAFLGEAVDVGGFVEVASIASQIPPAKVIDQEKNDIGRPGGVVLLAEDCSRPKGERQKQTNADWEFHHFTHKEG